MLWGVLINNLIVVDRGLNSIRNLMSSGTGDADTAPTIGVVGSIASPGSAFTPLASDTSLTGSYYGDTFDVNTVSDKQNNYELLLSVSQGNAQLQSIGIFNTGGELFAEDTFTSFNKTGSMEIQFDINLTYADL